MDLIWEVGGIVTPRKHGGFRSRSSPGSSETPRRLEAIIKELKREKAEVEGKVGGGEGGAKRQLELHLAAGAQRLQHIATYIQEKKLELVAKLLSMLRI